MYNHYQNYKGYSAFGYARKSNESEDKQVQSIPDQLIMFNKLSERHELKFIGYQQDSKSAKDPFLRDGLNDLIEKMRAGEFEVIVCWKLNRLARNLTEGGIFIDYLRDGKLKAIITHNRIFTPADSTHTLSAEFCQSKEASKDISSDVKRGQRLKAQRGWYPGANLPMGYKYNYGYKVEGGDPYIPNNNFPLLQALWFETLEKGYSIPDIKRRGDEMGIRNIKSKKFRGNEFSYHAYQNAFTNPFYSTGEFWWNTDEGPKEKYYGKHVKMLSESEFNKIQLQLGKRGRPTRINKYTASFNGCLSCGECGCAVTEDRVFRATCEGCKKRFSIKTNTACPSCKIDVSEMSDPKIYDRAYYRCTKKKGKCSQPYIESTEAERQFQEKLSTVEISKDFHDWAIAGFQFLHTDEISKQDKFNRSITKKETELVKQLREFTMMRSKKEITPEELVEYKASVTEELENVRNSKKEYHQQVIDWVEIAERYSQYASIAPQEFASASKERKADILRTFGSNLLIKDGKLDFTTPKALTSIKSAYNYYDLHSDTLEPLKSVVEQGITGDFTPEVSRLLLDRDSNPD